MANFRVVFVFVLSVLALVATPAFSNPTSSCKSITFSTKKTFAKCIDLPTLSAVLHYTYNPTESTLTMAYTAPPTVSNGWVAWALNPTATVMSGSQTLMAYKPNSGPITVNTLNIVSYGSIIKGPISYNVTNLSAEETNGLITIFATWVIPHGKKSVNSVWQVGPIVDGEPGVHDFKPDNLGSTMKLSLATGLVGGPATPSSGAPISTNVEVPAAAPVGSDGNAPAPSAQTGGAPRSVVSLMMVLSALVVCFF